MSPGDEVRLGYLVGRLDRVYRRELGAIVAERDLSVPAYTALSVLRRRPGLSNAQLARRSLVAPQSTNAIVVELLDRGLVRRSVDPAHGRILQTRLTADGERLIARCERAARALEERMLDGLGDPEREALRRALEHGLENLGAGVAEPSS